MARNDRRNPHRTTEDLRGISDYYKLHTKAVDDLADQDPNHVPEYSEEELKRYRKKGGIHLPEWLKACLIKAWFAGAVCFFIFWGLGIYVPNMLDMMVVLGIVLGIVTDLMVNNIFRFYEETPGANDKWMMFPKKRYSNFFFNMVYGFVLLFCVYTWYQFLNGMILAIAGPMDTVPIGVEPVLFGTFYTAFDMLFIGMKHLFLRVVADAKKRPA